MFHILQRLPNGKLWQLLQQAYNKLHFQINSVEEFKLLNNYFYNRFAYTAF